MLLNGLRFLRGYVSFTVSGKYPERFINITSHNRIRLWNVHRQGEGFCACMYRSDYRRIRPLARGAGVKLRATAKGGLPSYVFRFRDRVGLVIGACAFLLSVFLMSLFIWSIDITGLDRVSQTQMKELLREQGMYVGAFKPNLDYQQIARNIMLENHEIGWMAVNVTSSFASVEVKEEAPAPEVENVYEPQNVKAKCDGQILRIEAHEGETVLTEGSGVIEGQLIVSGVKGDEQGTYRLVHADARVLARTTREASFSTSENLMTLRPSDETAVRNSLVLFGLRLPYHISAVSSPYSVADIRSEAPAPLGVELPVGITVEKVSALNYDEQKLNENSAKELLQYQSELYETFSLSECTVEKRDYRLTHKDGVYTLNVTYTCVEDIACAEPIGTDENTDLKRYEPPKDAKSDE